MFCLLCNFSPLSLLIQSKIYFLKKNTKHLHLFIILWDFLFHPFMHNHHQQPSATSVLLFIHSFFFRWKSWVIMEWRKTTRNSINEIAVSSHFKSSLQQNEHKSAGNNLSISQNTLQAELFLLLDAKIFLLTLTFRECEWKIVAHLTRIFHCYKEEKSWQQKWRFSLKTWKFSPSRFYPIK